MTIVRVAAHALLRTVALALALLAYDRVYDLVVPATPDADIGKGLLAFLMIVGICFLWGLLDGFVTAPVVWILAWVVAGFALSAGWEAWLADGSLAQMQTGAIVFVAQLVIAPALVGAALSWALNGRTREPRLAH